VRRGRKRGRLRSEELEELWIVLVDIDYYWRGRQNSVMEGTAHNDLRVEGLVNE
jgi:hypothetical protein